MAHSSLTRSVRSGIGHVDAKDLGADDTQFGWQQPQGQTMGNGGIIEVALPREGTPQGMDFVLIRDSENPGTVLAFSVARWDQLTAAIQAGQYARAR